jgi:hypothetical protein
MGNKYPLQSINWVKSIQLGNTDHKSNQNTFNSYTPASYTQSVHISSLESCNDRYITTNRRVINNLPSGARLAYMMAKWSDHNIDALDQAVKVGNKYPSTNSKKVSD